MGHQSYLKIIQNCTQSCALAILGGSWCKDTLEMEVMINKHDAVWVTHYYWFNLKYIVAHYPHVLTCFALIILFMQLLVLLILVL